MPFVKLDCGIANSSLWVDRDIRSLFITALILAEPRELQEPAPQLEIRSLAQTGFSVPPGWYGFVEASGIALIQRDGIGRADGYDALERLGAPDPDSRSEDYEGRRLVRINGGFVVLNYFSYRERDYTAADRQRRFRLKQKEERAARRQAALEAAAEAGADGADEATEQPADASVTASVTSVTVTPGDAERHGESVTSRRDVTLCHRSRRQKAEAEAERDDVVVGADDPKTSPLIHIATVEKSVTPPARPITDPDQPHHPTLRDRALALCTALNSGLHDNPLVGEHPQPVLANSASAIQAAEDLATDGVDHEWALRATYTIGRTFKPEKPGQTIGSLAYVVPRLEKPWSQHLARIAVATAERPPEAANDLGGTERSTPAPNGGNGRQGVRRDRKGEALIIFGRLRDAVREEAVLNNPEMGMSGGNRLERVIPGAVLAALDDAARAALQAIGGPRSITHPRDTREGADGLGWKFAAAYASASE